MFENRSFDNMLGWLYTADEKSQDQFDGLAQGSYSNVGLDGETVPAYVYDGHRRTRSCSRPSPIRARRTRT